MTVHELIELLESFDPDATVMRQTSDWACCYDVVDVVTYNGDELNVFLEFDDEDELDDEVFLAW